MKQIILVKTETGTEFNRIKESIERGLENSADRFIVPGGYNTEIEVIELPDTKELPTVIHNSYMGMQQADIESIVINVLDRVLRSSEKIPRL